MPKDPFQELTLVNNELANLSRELTRKNRELERALNEIKVLKGLLPICAHCKRIRDDDGYWQMLEQYITDNSEAVFSHSVCDECIAEHYSDLDDED